MSQQQNLPSQVGFYLLPPDQKLLHRSRRRRESGSTISQTDLALYGLPPPQPPQPQFYKPQIGRGLKNRNWKSQSHLDVITEVNEDSRATTPRSPFIINSPHLLRY